MIGYYIHHHGRGHLHRAVCIARHLRQPVTGLSSLSRPPEWPGGWLQLTDDTGGNDHRDVQAAGRLHWAPLRHSGYRGRMGAIAEWIVRTDPALLVSDVSVEVSCLARLLGVPLVVAAMRGSRTDEPHLLGYDLALSLLAPWPAEFPEPAWPQRWRTKTVHSGAFSRHDGRQRVTTQQCRHNDRRVVMMLGAGGSEVTAEKLCAARAATPSWNWHVLGGPAGVWCQDPWPLLCEADVVVVHGGQNAIAECAAARRPAVVLPQVRPFNEQHATGRALTSGGLAVVREQWPEPGEWLRVLDDATALGGEGWVRWAPGDGAQRAAAHLDGLAAGYSEESACRKPL
ncbi:hypothetical protein FBY35_3792 [Streptomyces sp. SLBN-118]|uniref:UDP-N-acetylglucosamine--N-acetylmuramyl- (pentapeptide) pyrophosphoryl-undecaprenol N-acetylglucosamine transferase n=1 Tax=Streptomyces sp. SLBN-118 TaxID=2768454 RepID=UPI001154F072|nr:UDP-N-acetylglucosamine--N-acetylmuramyl-(pentapeptide) pyrophosphoryl-undecaprenol N-acetylglucosamine transferase [Streptomyces sp. SLBN-118]TQK42392.1 hypothetical protein FBY35_3792 [Streptomyces sp. SLBN-118]